MSGLVETHRKNVNCMINLLGSRRRGSRLGRFSGGGDCGFKPAQLALLPEADGAIGHAGIARSLKFLIKNFDAKIKIGGLEKVAGLSRRGFLKAFLKHTGHRPGVVLRHLRIEHAKQLLVESDLPLIDLARLSGFKSANTFCVAFQRLTGFSPKKFQRQAWLMTYMNQAIVSKPIKNRRALANRRRLFKNSKNGR